MRSELFAILPDIVYDGFPVELLRLGLIFCLRSFFILSLVY